MNSKIKGNIGRKLKDFDTIFEKIENIRCTIKGLVAAIKKPPTLIQKIKKEGNIQEDNKIERIDLRFNLLKGININFNQWKTLFISMKNNFI